MGARAFSRAVMVLCLAGLSLALWSSSAAFADECSNEVRREEQNATFLPDCRAYEMVSPLDKKGSDVAGNGKMIQASLSGDRIAYTALAGFGDVAGSGLVGYTQYLAERQEGKGWASHGVTPTPARDAFMYLVGATAMPVFSDSMDKGFIEGYDLPGASNDVTGGVNDYVESTGDRALETVTDISQAEGFVSPFAFEEKVRGISKDQSTVALETELNLLPGLPEGDKLYAWRHDVLSVAGVLPDGTMPAGGSSAPLNPASVQPQELGTVSDDGSRILFLSPADGSKPPELYMRRNGSDTVRLSESEASSPSPEPNEVSFKQMSGDGKEVLFTSKNSLTDSDPGGEGAGLYIYTDSPEPRTEANLTFVVRGGQSVIGMSTDAKRIYFYNPAPTVSVPTMGTYLWDEGTLRLAAPTSGIIDSGFRESEYFGLAEVSDDGRQLAFLWPSQLTEAPTADNLDAMYVYDEPTETLRCVSCLPSGATTMSPTEIEPRATSLSVNVTLWIRPRFLSADGRYVFFSTGDALVSSDTNKLYDVYEYDTQTGTVSLISSGTGEDGSWFVGSGADGRDAFFVSRQSHLAQDTDTLVDLYDARIGGGFPQPVPSTGGCVGDECQGVPSAAPSFNTASGFSGLGNVVHSVLGKAKPRTLTRGQKLKRALKACKRKKGRARHRCEAKARRRYGVHKASKSTSRGARR